MSSIVLMFCCGAVIPGPVELVWSAGSRRRRPTVRVTDQGQLTDETKHGLNCMSFVL